MAVTMAEITKLRKISGAGMMDCKNNAYPGLFTGFLIILYPIAAIKILITGLIRLKKQ